jgi:hypothetical protein
MSAVVGLPERCPGARRRRRAGRQGGEEQDDAQHKPRSGVVCGGERHTDRRADDWRDRGPGVRGSSRVRQSRPDVGPRLERAECPGPFGEAPRNTSPNRSASDGIRITAPMARGASSATSVTSPAMAGRRSASAGSAAVERPLIRRRSRPSLQLWVRYGLRLPGFRSKRDRSNAGWRSVTAMPLRGGEGGPARGHPPSTLAAAAGPGHDPAQHHGAAARAWARLRSAAPLRRPTGHPDLGARGGMMRT